MALRRGRALLAFATILVLAPFLCASAVLFVWPSADTPRRVDAIVSLDGPDEAAREAKAVSLAEEGYARVLLFSQGNYRSTPCPAVASVVVVCFWPHPARTAGEVEWVARYARAHHFRSLMLVPGRAQATRARILMRRCFSGRLVVVPAPASFGEVAQQVVYEWGALAKALMYTHC